MTVASLYRDAHQLGEDEVTFDSFMQAAEKRQFFSECLRLPPYVVAQSDRRRPRRPGRPRGRPGARRSLNQRDQARLASLVASTASSSSLRQKKRTLT